MLLGGGGGRKRGLAKANRGGGGGDDRGAIWERMGTRESELRWEHEEGNGIKTVKLFDVEKEQRRLTRFPVFMCYVKT